MDSSIYLRVAREVLFVSSLALGTSLVIYVQALAGLVTDTTTARATTFRWGTPFCPLRAIAFPSGQDMTARQVHIGAEFPLWP